MESWCFAEEKETVTSVESHEWLLCRHSVWPSLLAGLMKLTLLRSKVCLWKCPQFQVHRGPHMHSMWRQASTHLIGEGAGHDKGWVACRAAQIEQAPLRKHNHTMAIREDEAVTLRLDVLALDTCNVTERVIRLSNISSVSSNAPHRSIALGPHTRYLPTAMQLSRQARGSDTHQASLEGRPCRFHCRSDQCCQ